jgi:hypothetical protein
MKRTLGQEEEPALPTRRQTRSQTAKHECPVCLAEKLTETDIAFSFHCGHHVCSSCDLKLIQRDDLRCPTCRAVRQGHTEVEAEQAATRRAHEDAPSGFPAPPGILSLAQLLSGRGTGRGATVVMNLPPSSILDFEAGAGLGSEVGPFEFVRRIRVPRTINEGDGEDDNPLSDPEHPIHSVRGFLHAAFNHLGGVPPAAFREQLDQVVAEAAIRRAAR